jgi:hypothetical protein
MSVWRSNNTTASATQTIAVDAERIVTEVFPDFSLRSWRRWDAAGKTPRGFMVGGRKVWRIADLKQWAEWGFPARATFEAHLWTEKGAKQSER